MMLGAVGVTHRAAPEFWGRFFLLIKRRNGIDHAEMHARLIGEQGPTIFAVVAQRVS